jgi:peptide/nickel transport system permease protein
MLSYIARRLAFGILTIIGVSIVVFVIMRVLPGDPLVALFGPDGFTKLTEEQRAQYMADLGLSDPLWKQYLAWVGDIARGEFGRSFFRAESVAEMISRRAPLTAQIAFLSVVFSWLVGIPVALVSALKPNSAWDNVTRFFSILFLAIPGFWFGILIVLALLFWFGYRAPLTGAPFFSDLPERCRRSAATGWRGRGRVRYFRRTFPDWASLSCCSAGVTTWWSRAQTPARTRYDPRELRAAAGPGPAS